MAVIEGEEGIQFFHPILQEYLFFHACLVFGKIQPHGNDAVEGIDFCLVQVIFGNGYIGFGDFFAPPMGQPHIGFPRICPLVNDFRGGMAGASVVKFVLYDFEKMGGFFEAGLVIRRHGEYFAHTQIHPPFAAADVPDTVEQLFKLIFGTVCPDRRVFQPIVV